VPFTVRLSRQARRYIERADAETRRRLLNVLDEMAANPYGGDMRPLRGRPGQWRRRVGDLRMIYRVDDTNFKVDVAIIGARGDVY